ncbi:hypothetical protein [Microvirga antarctica]|uniref:hypothetical protein n=1 Tax=Microvirga antarctica TaxID=2819233 RepID=UPI001B30358F|nr:hypothetical protein [Microvirga antarctica]
MSGTTDLTPWRHFSLWFAATSFAVTALLFGFVLAFDPYGLRAAPGRAASPLMDINQRFMYPQIARGGIFDSAVFGTSTVRLLDPARLDRAFGGAFVNFGMNAATPWEQLQLASLYLRRQPEPRTLMFGLDETWCAADADEKRLTFRAFPPWLYDDDPLNDYPALLNLTTLEIAGRVALNRLGMLPARLPQNGYEIFLPDDAAYDLERARMHIQRSGSGMGEIAAAAAVGAQPFKLPAVDWLDELLARVKPSTRVAIAFMPAHAVMLPPPSSVDFQREAACKARVADLGRRHGALVLDFRLRSNVTTDDSNYWDALHYRVGIADRIVDGLRDAGSTGNAASDGFYTVLNRPQP